jgi:hypothetical protein
MIYKTLVSRCNVHSSVTILLKGSPEVINVSIHQNLSGTVLLVISTIAKLLVARCNLSYVQYSSVAIHKASITFSLLSFLIPSFLPSRERFL